MAEAPKKLSELIALGDAFLARNAIPDSRVVCELLAARLFKCGRLELYRHADSVPDTRIVDALRRGLQRVVKGEPVQYVLGQWDFRKLTLKVDRRALIPRPETEQLVDLVLTSAHVRQVAKPLVVDVGTGTGCIILSLASELRDGVFVGLDISPEALSLAKENAALTGLQERVMFAESDGCGEFDPASVMCWSPILLISRRTWWTGSSRIFAITSRGWRWTVAPTGWRSTARSCSMR